MKLEEALLEICKEQGYKSRDVQIRAIKWLEEKWNTKNTCKVMSIPTGGGKSIIAMTIAKYLESQKKTCAIITPQNLLIDQYAKDFVKVNFFKGKSNYKCKMAHDSCEVGSQLKKISNQYKCESCPYEKAKIRAYKDKVTIFNPISFFVLPKNKKNDEKFEVLYEPDTIIIDEVQSLSGMLRELVTIKFWENNFKWEKGITSSIPALIEALKKYSDDLSDTIFRGKSLSIKDKTKILLVQKKVDFLIQQLTIEAQYFICEEGEEVYRGTKTRCLTIRPKYVPKNILKRFFKSANRIIFLSGTVLPYMWKELGFDEIDYIDLPSPIPKERQPIFITNSLELAFRRKDRDAMCQDTANQIRYIIETLHPKQNGVILLPYNLASELSLYLTEDYFIHMDKKSKKEKIKQFLEGKEYGVGIFSGAYEGLDLKHDLSRFTIIPKVPFPNITDNVVSARMKESYINYCLETMTHIMQATGRSIRDASDWGYTYILDKNFVKLYSSTLLYLPKSFRERVVISQPKDKHIEFLKILGDQKK